MTIQLKEPAGAVGLAVVAMFIGALCHVALLGGV